MGSDGQDRQYQVEQRHGPRGLCQVPYLAGRPVLPLMEVSGRVPFLPC